MNDFFEGLGQILENDKALVIFVILMFGCISLFMKVDGSMALIEKMTYGLFGLVTGIGIAKK